MDFVNGNFFIKLKSAYNGLRKSEKIVADYMIEHGEDIIPMTLAEMSRNLHTNNNIARLDLMSERLQEHSY